MIHFAIVDLILRRRLPLFCIANYMHQRQTLSDNIFEIYHDAFKLNENLLTNKLLFENPKYNVSINSDISMISISYILSGKSFERNLDLKLCGT